MGHVIVKKICTTKRSSPRTEAEYRKIVEGPESVEDIGVSASEIRRRHGCLPGQRRHPVGHGCNPVLRGVETVRSLTNLAMLTGNLGKPHAVLTQFVVRTAFRIACDMGALPDTSGIPVRERSG